MSAYYLDTSAVVKGYAHEIGTPWVLALVDPGSGHELVTVRLTGPELVAALARKGRTGALTIAEAASAIGIFRRTWRRYYRTVAVSDALIEQAMDIAERHNACGYDAVHIAAALSVTEVRQRRGLSALIFVSADNNQRQVASLEGLSTDNPAAHP